MRPNPVRQHVGIHSTRLASDLLAVLEQDDGGNTADIESAGGARICLRVELREPDSRFQIGRYAVEMRCHHFAWPTPLGPKIDYKGSATAIYMGREIGVG